MNLFKITAREWKKNPLPADVRRSKTSLLKLPIIKTLGLIRLSRILSYTNHESGKFQSFHVQTSWQYNSQ